MLVVGVLVKLEWSVVVNDSRLRSVNGEDLKPAVAILDFADSSPISGPCVVVSLKN